MSYGNMAPPYYADRLLKAQAEQDQREQDAQQHIAAVLRGAQAQEAVSPLLARMVAALERIAAAQERAYPDKPPQVAPPGP